MNDLLIIICMLISIIVAEIIFLYVLLRKKYKKHR